MKRAFLFFTLASLTIACSSSDESDSASTSYDRTALLTNWADNIIVPSFENYQAKVNDLAAKSTVFTDAPTAENLTAMRTSWLNAYKAYQYASMYSFGKAEQVFMKDMTNTYPTNTAAIETNIANASYNLSVYAQLDKQGFPAVDYMINGLGNNDTAILTFYTTNANASGYKSYLTALSARLKSIADAIVTDWNSGYRDTYVASNGTSVSSSVNKTANNFVKNLERDVRNGKVGIPAGMISGGTLYPNSVEAVYKGNVSKELLTTAMSATKDFFIGKHFNDQTTGEGFKSYLDQIKAVRDGQNLSAIIISQIDAAGIGVNTLNESFTVQVNTDNSKMVEEYNKLQQLVILTKLDMMQALNITVDYVDGDGD